MIAPPIRGPACRLARPHSSRRRFYPAYPPNPSRGIFALAPVGRPAAGACAARSRGQECRRCADGLAMPAAADSRLALGSARARCCGRRGVPFEVVPARDRRGRGQGGDAGRGARRRATSPTRWPSSRRARRGRRPDAAGARRRPGAGLRRRASSTSRATCAEARAQLAALRGRTHELLSPRRWSSRPARPVWRHVGRAQLTMRPFSGRLSRRLSGGAGRRRCSTTRRRLPARGRRRAALQPRPGRLLLRPRPAAARAARLPAHRGGSAWNDRRRRRSPA